MDAIEKAIRKALEKGDAGNQTFRERVYKSAFAALERALNSRETITDEAAERRRRNLRLKIAQIESEFVPANSAPTPPEPGSESLTAAADKTLSPEAQAPAVDPSDRLSAADDAEVTGDDIESDDSRPRRRPFAMMFMVVVVLVAVATVAWVVMQSGILGPEDERAGAVPNPPPQLEDENFRPEKLPDDADSDDAAVPRRWIGIFEPVESSGVTVPGGAEAQITERDGESYLRVRTSGEVEVLFDVGQGTLERIAGGRALFSISARAQEEQTIQFSVACDLAELGDCGRKRYEVNATLSEFLFEIELPNRDPGAAGTIAINPDVSGQRGVLDIRQIRVAITQ